MTRATRGSLVLCALLLAGCSSAAGPQGTLQGTASLGPTSPTCEIERPCSEPYSGPLDLVRAGKVVRQFEASNGTFALRVAPGLYSIAFEAKNGWPRCQSPQVEVGADATSEVAVDCDSGIR